MLTAFASAQSDGRHHRHKGPGSGTQSRTFNFSASDFLESDLSQNPQPVLASASNIVVNNYLYVEGHLSANWHVTGWGSGSSSHHVFIYVYHSDTVSIVFSGFDNPTKTQGTITGSQSIDLSARLQVYNEDAWTQLMDTGLVPIGSLNSMFSGSGRPFTTNSTGGGMAIEFTRQINVKPENGQGVYENVGMIKVSRN